MLRDCLESPPVDTVTADICIVGAGIAGTVLAESLVDSGLDVCVIESGDKVAGESYSLSKLAVTSNSSASDKRMQFHSQRVIGGGGTVWSGLCRELDEEDFQSRDYIPHSGWPIEKSELSVWYQRSRDALKMVPYDENPLNLERKGEKGGKGSKGGESRQEYRLGSTNIIQDVFWLSEERFTNRWLNDLGKKPNLRLFYNATVVDLTPNLSNNHITQVTAKTLNGKTFNVKAKAVIVCCGGIGTPQLLLQARDKHSSSAFHNDWIGRCFMEHPHFEPALMVWLNDSLKVDTHWTAGRFSCFYLQRKLREQQGLLACSYTMKNARGHKVTANSVMTQLENKVDEAVLKEIESHTHGMFDDKGSWHMAFMRAEMAPNRENRVTLQDQFNVLGEKKTHLEFNYSNRDYQSIEQSNKLFVQELLKVDPSVQARSFLTNRERYAPFMDIGGHYMGTTRMAENEKEGCLDKDCRLFGMENLYVASSSSFPTSGFSNPTQTIVALTLRLADTVKKLYA